MPTARAMLLLLGAVAICSAERERRVPAKDKLDDLTVCLQDMYKCPDDTWVSRTGPKCEFVCKEEEDSEEPSGCSACVKGGGKWQIGQCYRSCAVADVSCFQDEEGCKQYELEQTALQKCPGHKTCKDCLGDPSGLCYMIKKGEQCVMGANRWDANLDNWVMDGDDCPEPSGELGIGDVCYQFYEDGSKPHVNRKDECPDGTECKSDGSIGWNSVMTCEPTPGEPTPGGKCDPATDETWSRVTEYCGKPFTSMQCECVDKAWMCMVADPLPCHSDIDQCSLCLQFQFAWFNGKCVEECDANNKGCHTKECPVDDEVFCPEDLQTCDDGSVVVRDPNNDCQFPKCPEIRPCNRDARVCDDGSVVVRDPSNNCEFPECPECVPCNMDAKVCPDGKTTVGRDCYNDCEWQSCPTQACNKDAKECPDGSTVGRDGDNGCAWFPCPGDKCDLKIYEGRTYEDDAHFGCPVGFAAPPRCAAGSEPVSVVDSGIWQKEAICCGQPRWFCESTDKKAVVESILKDAGIKEGTVVAVAAIVEEKLIADKRGAVERILKAAGIAADDVLKIAALVEQKLAEGETIESLLTWGEDLDDGADLVVALRDAGVDVSAVAEEVATLAREDDSAVLSVADLLEDETVQTALTNAGVDAEIMTQLTKAATGAEDDGDDDCGDDDDECGGAAAISSVTVAVAAGGALAIALL